VAILSYFLPEFLIKKEIKKASEQIKEIIPEVQKPSVLQILEKLQKRASKELSGILLGVTLFCFALALILLAFISKRVTRGISLIAKGLKEVEKGRYEDLEFPKVDHRKDEVAILSQGFQGMVTAIKEREKIRGVLNKVVSKEIAGEILKSDIELGGEERVVTMLFSDIRGFTKMTENVEPKVLINLMNTYLTEVCRIIDDHKGVVDKFVGDEVMALYGVPYAQENDALLAIQTAQEMIQSLKKTNEKRALKNLPAVEIGIGIHTGLVVAGNVGSENRLNYTVLGANVNLAARLCSAAKGMQILISEDTLNQPGVQSTFNYEEVPPIPLKGVMKPVKLYEIKK